MSDPVSQTILLLDTERHSDRDDIERAYLRRMLYDITDRALERAGIDETLRLRAGRGDPAPVMELIDAGASVPALLRALLTEIPAQLRTVNRMASSSAQIRLRGVVASGYVTTAPYGWAGSGLDQARRLLDSGPLREALRERPGDFALCVCESVCAGIPAADFHPMTVDGENGPLKAWLHGPPPQGAAGPDDHSGTGVGGAPVPGASGDGPAPGRAAAPSARRAPGGVVLDFGGGAVAADQHGASGGQGTGDVHLGGTGGDAA
ncbi:hypothetical protein [Streptomyces sp. NPDC006739]|uniref:hypothetical protein n=1 Tax=Streptomyces sp. NPDC006739 TaxID=3364763 RepID=UPI003698B54B